MKGSVKFITIIVLLCVSSAFAADWPQFLGPNRDSTSPETGILRSWPESGPEVLWTVELGTGFGGPVVKDGKVYLLDRDDQVGDTMRCYDLSSGKELWSFSYDAPGSVQFPGSRSVPAVDGNYVYSCGHNGDLYCIDINIHKPVWNKNVWTDFGGDRIPQWAITQCPLVYGDLLIVASQAPKACVVAYDKLTGDVKWTSEMSGAAGYASPAIVKVGEQDQVVMMTAASGFGRNASGGMVTGIDPQTGKTLWKYDGWQCIIPIPSAFDAGEDIALIIGPYNAGAVMLKIEPQEDGSYEVNELFKTVEFGAHTKPPILHNGYFYAQYTTNERSDGLVCMSMDGEIKWKTGRSPAFNKGGMILVDGLILATDGSTKLYLIEPDPTEFKPLASAEMLTVASQGGGGRGGFGGGFGDELWAAIALSDGKLLIRDKRQMKCVKVAE